MAKAWRFLAAGLAAFGVAGRPGHTVYFEHFAAPDQSRHRERSDAEALGGDWRAVGNDLQGAMDAMADEVELAGEAG